MNENNSLNDLLENQNSINRLQPETPQPVEQPIIQQPESSATSGMPQASVAPEEPSFVAPTLQPEIQQPVEQPIVQQPESSATSVMPQAPVAPEEPSFVAPTQQPVLQQSNVQPIQAFQEQNKASKKKFNPIIIVIIVLILVIGGIAFIFLGRNNSKASSSSTKALINIYESNEGIAVINDEGKYGFLTYEGEKLTDFKYNLAIGFYDGYAYVEDETGGHIVDSKFNNIMDAYSATYILSGNVWIIDSHLYDSKMKKISEIDGIEDSYLENTLIFSSYGDNPSEGIIDYTGKVLYEEFGDLYINDIESTDEYVVVSKDNKYAIVNYLTGKKVFDYQNYEIEVEDYDCFALYDDGYNVVKTIYIIDDKIVFEYDGEAEIGYYDEYNGILQIKPEEEGTFYYYLKDKNRYDYYNDIYEKYNLTEVREYIKEYNYIVFKGDNGYGLKQGDNILLEPKYSDIFFPYLDDLKFAKSRGKTTVFLANNADGRIIIYDLDNKKELFEFNDVFYYMFFGPSFPYIVFDGKVCNLDNEKCSENVNAQQIYSDRGNYVIVMSTSDNNATYFVFNRDMKLIHQYHLEY